jgi:hypothetical protein
MAESTTSSLPTFFCWATAAVAKATNASSVRIVRPANLLDCAAGSVTPEIIAAKIMVVVIILPPRHSS